MRNRVTSVEVGMQVDECISDTGALQEWGEWGECSSQCGNGVQWRTKECRADGKLILPPGIQFQSTSNNQLLIFMNRMRIRGKILKSSTK